MVPEFDACPKFSELSLIPSGSPRLNTIHLIAGAYTAGPYAEGEYDIPLPVTARLIAALKPEFRARSLSDNSWATAAAGPAFAAATARRPTYKLHPPRPGRASHPAVTPTSCGVAPLFAARPLYSERRRMLIDDTWLRTVADTGPEIPR